MKKKHIEKIEKVSRNYDKYLITVMAVLVFIILALIVYSWIIS